MKASSITMSLLQSDDLTSWLLSTIARSQDRAVEQDFTDDEASAQKAFDDAVTERDAFEALSQEEKVAKAVQGKTESLEVLATYVEEKKVQLAKLKEGIDKFKAVKEKAKNKDLLRVLEQVIKYLEEDYKNNDDVELASKRIEMVKEETPEQSIEDEIKVLNLKVDMMKQALGKAQTNARKFEALSKEFKKLMK